MDISFDWSTTFLHNEDLESEDVGAIKAAYIVTLPHPKGNAFPADLLGLRAPGDFSHQAIETVIRDVFSHPVYEDARHSMRYAKSELHLKSSSSSVSPTAVSME